MTEIIYPRDPVLEAIAYLRTWWPDAAVGLEVPPEWEWGPLLIVVTDVGGPGERDVVLDDANLMVEVSCADAKTASEVAREIHGLLRLWTEGKNRIYWRGTIQRPTYSPDAVTGTPAYSLTVALTFRATTKVV